VIDIVKVVCRQNDKARLSATLKRYVAATAISRANGYATSVTVLRRVFQAWAEIELNNHGVGIDSDNVLLPSPKAPLPKSRQLKPRVLQPGVFYNRPSIQKVSRRCGEIALLASRNRRNGEQDFRRGEIRRGGT
jgi:hypothetical protein